MKLAILGPGRIAQGVAPTLAAMPEIECYAVASRTPGKAEAFAQRFGFQKAYTSYEEMLSDPEVELVYITTPHSHHFEHMMLCLQYGKHVICEKPCTTTETQTRELFALAKEKKLFLMEAQKMLFLPAVLAAKEAIDKGALGKVRIAEFNHSFYGSYNNHNSRRDRKLLLTKREIDKLKKVNDDVGFTIIPLRLFISEKGYAKLVIGVGRGKKAYDKRQSIKEREDKRSIDRMFKR